ncbi:hypothetical protein KR200_004553 [Drosophila serrata]|nr:hypothetical protein KR200_004553 [Drosophila serrata]
MSIASWIITFALLLLHQGSAQLLDRDCGVASDAIDGVRPNPFPWLALIRSNNQKCSGVLIDQQYVITAASCLINSTQTLVRLGDFDQSHQKENVTNFPYEQYYVRTAIVHNSYNERENLNDLALLQLHGKVTYKPHIRPICILLYSTLKARVDALKTFGATLWGLNEMRPFEKPRTHTINRLNATECTEISAPKKTEICASFTSGANCLELGSPLGKMFQHKNTTRYTLYGIQSYGTSKTCMYTDIMSYVDWIVENVLEVRILNLETPKIER